MAAGAGTNGSSYEGAMQNFVHERLLGLLQPVSEHVGALLRQVSKLEHENHSRDVAQKHSDAKLEQLEAQFRAFGIEFDQAKAKLNLTQSSTDVISRRLGQEADDVAKLGKRLQQGETKIREAFAKIKDLLQNSQTSQGHIEELQLEAKRTAAVVENLDLGTSKLHESLEQLLSETAANAEQIKHHAEKSNMDLQELASSAEDRNSDIQNNMRSIAAYIDKSDKTLAVVKSDMSIMESRLDAHIEKCNIEQQRILAELEGQITINVKQEDELMDGVTPREAIVQCLKRLASQKEQSEKLAKQLTSLKEELSSKHTVSQKAIASNADQLERLKQAQQKAESNLTKASRQLDAQSHAHAKLQQQTNHIDTYFKKVEGLQKDTVGELETQARESGRTQRRVEELERKLGDAGTRLDQLSTEVSATSEGMSKTAVRIDLAHDYLHGIGKGMQDAHKHAANGMDGVLPYMESVWTPRIVAKLPSKATPLATDFSPEKQRAGTRPVSSRISAERKLGWQT